MGECLGRWWRVGFETLLLPYLPPNVRSPKVVVAWAPPASLHLIAWINMSSLLLICRNAEKSFLWSCRKGRSSLYRKPTSCLWFPCPNFMKTRKYGNFWFLNVELCIYRDCIRSLCFLELLRHLLKMIMFYLNSNWISSCIEVMSTNMLMPNSISQKHSVYWSES